MNADLHGKIPAPSAVLHTWLVCLALCAWFPEAKSADDAELKKHFQGHLQLLDGSSLRGSLLELSDQKGELHWQHQDIAKPMRIRPNYLAWVRFAHSVAPRKASPSHRFQFHNGDEIYGSLVHLNEEFITLDSALTGPLRAPKEAVRSIHRLSDNHQILYQGPVGLEGWSLGQRKLPGWEYRDGAFYSRRAGVLGRDFSLVNSATIEFDLSWENHFALVVSIFSKIIDRFDYSNTAYKFYFGKGYVNLRRTKTGAGPMNLGRIDLPSMLQKNQVHIQILANKSKGRLALWVDGTPIHIWQEPGGLQAVGSGLVFYNQRDNPPIYVQNLRITSWNGEREIEEIPEINAAPTPEDWLYFINRDRVAGRLVSVKDQRILFATDRNEFKIPLGRITQIFFSPAKYTPPNEDPSLVRTYIAGGGTVTLQLKQWSDSQVKGHSPNFGELTLNPAAIRKIRFNLNKVKEFSPEPDPWDDSIWQQKDG